MEEKRYIGFDLGAESGRCVVACLNEDKITLHEVHRFTTHNIKYGNSFFWDILAIYQEIIEGLIKANRDFGSSFNGIGIDTWGVDYVLIDHADRILGYPYHYRDERTDNIMDKAFEIASRNQIYNKAGIQFLQFNTLFQLLSEKKYQLNLLNISSKMLLIPDFLNFLLSGSRKAEFTIASTTSLADPITRKWSWELIDQFCLPRNIFPEMIEPGTTLGTLLPSIAKQTGLDSDIPVIASAGHDTAAGVASAPGCGDEWAFLSSGTWSLMGVELDQPLLTSKALEFNFTNEGGIEQKTIFLKNIIGLWPIQECRRYWQQHAKEYSYAEMASMAQDFGNANAWVDLDDPRFLKVGEMPEKVLAYLRETGQQNIDDAGFIVRVILESLAFSYRLTLNKIEIVTGKEIKNLHAVGGGTQNVILSQLTADAINRDVIAGPVEGTALGNIGVQAIASGAVPDLTAWRKVIKNSFECITYSPKQPDYFNENEQKYKNILKYN